MVGAVCRFARLIEHLLKWQFQPERRGTSWKRTIAVQRERIKLLLEENPSLRPGLDSVISKAYREAAGNIAIIIGRSRKDFPETCPYATDQLLDEDFLP